MDLEDLKYLYLRNIAENLVDLSYDHDPYEFHDNYTDKEEALFKGVDLVYKQLKDSLTKFGVEEIEADDDTSSLSTETISGKESFT